MVSCAQWLVTPDVVFNIFGITFLSYTVPSSCVAEGGFFSYFTGVLKVRISILWSFLSFWTEYCFWRCNVGFFWSTAKDMQ